jgi:hypothetical protein
MRAKSFIKRDFIIQISCFNPHFTSWESLRSELTKKFDRMQGVQKMVAETYPSRLSKPPRILGAQQTVKFRSVKQSVICATDQ